MSKAILITGSTDGIGKLAAIQLAKEGHSIYIHGRNTEKVTKTISVIKMLSQNEEVHGYVADFSDLLDVQTLASQIIKEIPKLDVLINNAGVFKSPTEKSKQALDIRLAVNYIAPYLLTQALVPLLEPI